MNKRLRAKLLDSNGFSLIQVIVAAGLASFVSLGVASLFQQQKEMLSFVEDKLERASLEGELLVLMANESTCNNSLLGTSLAAGDVGLSIKDSNNNDLYNTVQKNEIGKIKLKEIKLENKTVAGGSSVGLVNLIVSPERMRKGIGPAVLQDIVIPIHVQTDSNNRVSGCITANRSLTSSSAGGGDKEGGPNKNGEGVGGGGNVDSGSSFSAKFRTDEEIYLNTRIENGPGWIKRERTVSKKSICFLTSIGMGGFNSYCKTEYLGNKTWKLTSHDVHDTGAMDSYTRRKHQSCNWWCMK